MGQAEGRAGAMAPGSKGRAEGTQGDGWEGLQNEGRSLQDLLGYFKAFVFILMGNRKLWDCSSGEVT